MNIEDFAYNVSRLRKEAQMSQGELAERMNVTISAVSKWENGKNFPGIETIEAIAAFFDVPIEVLINPYHESLISDSESASALVSYTEEHRTEETEETASTEASNIQIQKKTSKPFVRVIAITATLVCLCAAGFFAAAKLNTDTKQPIVVQSRIVEDATWGTTTELAVYYREEISDDMAHEYASIIREEWIHEDKYGGKSSNILKVLFYTNKSEARNFSDESDYYLMLFSHQ